MPVVPMSPGQTVREAPLQTPNIRPIMDQESFGGGESSAQVSEAARQVLNTGFKMAADEKQKADQVRVTEATDQTLQLKNRMFWDPKNGVMSKKGKDAFGASETYLAEFDKQSAEIENSLSNSAQKAAYAEVKRRNRLELQTEIEKYSFLEGQKYQGEVAEAGLISHRDDAVLNYAQPGKVQSSIENQKTIIAQQAIREGRSPEWVKLKTEEASSKTHSSVIQRMLSTGNDQMADKYFQEHKGEIDGGDIANVEKALEEGTLRGNAQRETDKIVASTKTLQQALEETRKIEDPKLRDETNSRVKTYYAEKKMAENDAKEDAYINATNIIEKTKNFDNVPPHLLTNMSPSERTSLRTYADNLREGKKPVTDWGEYYNFKSMASAPQTQNKFMQTNLMEYRNQLGDTEFKELINLQTQMRNGDTSAQKTIDGYRTDAVIVNDALTSAGFDPSPKPGTDEAKSVARFRRMVDEKIARQQAATGKKATNQEIQSIVDTMMVEGITEKGWFMDSRKRLFELEPGESIEIGQEDIPPSEQAKIKQALQKRGLPVTSENMVKLFKAKVSNGNK